MHTSKNETSFPGTWRVLFLLLFLIGVIYFNSLGASWHFDDYNAIVFNPKIHVDKLTPDALYQSLSAHQGKMVRPVSCLSLALNWRLGRDNVEGWHVVNIAIHVFTAWILFLTVLHLFRSPNLTDRVDPRGRFTIALLAAVLWAVNPIQTQAVTYIVQRMAAMAAMFTILAMLFYLKARLAGTSARKWGFTLACVFSFLLGLGSKENTALLPITLLLVEFMFFRDLGRRRTRKLFLGILVGGGILIVLLGGALFLGGDPTSVLNGYRARPFTPMERLLTQPRVLIFYLSQIVYPTPQRLSIEHDFALSTSVLEPWTTLPAILVVLGLIAFGVFQMRRRPLLAFGLLFFFVNHLIESTIVPLEIVFEHRNYLPSMFLFPPVAAGLHELMEHYRWKSPPMRWVLAAFICCLVIGLGFGVRLRNQAWATEKSLWEDALEKAPGSNRPYHNLAKGYYEKIGDIHTAIALYKKASELERHRKKAPSMMYFNIGGLYHAMGRHRLAAEWYRKALEVYPGQPQIRHRLAMTLLKLGDPARALEEAERLVSKHPGRAEYHNLKGVILFKMSRREEALASFRRSLGIRAAFRPALVNAGAVLAMSDAGPRAELILAAADMLDPGAASTKLWRIEAGLRAGSADRVDALVDDLFKTYSVNALASILERFAGGELSERVVSIPASDMSIFRKISDRMARKSKRIVSSDAGSGAP